MTEKTKNAEMSENGNSPASFSSVHVGQQASAQLQVGCVCVSCFFFQ